MQKDMIKILIADDHELFRKGIISLLINEGNIKIIGEACSGKDLLYKVLKLNPDLIITDISMPELSGLEAIKTLYEKDKNIKVIFLSMYGGEDYIYHCIKAGGSSLISKDVPKEELLFTIETVAKGGKYFGKEYPEERIEKLINNYEKNLENSGLLNSSLLTSKEEEILLLVAEGLTSNEIAEKLFIAKRTVDTHRTHMMQKLELKSLPQLLKYAISYKSIMRKHD